MQDGAVHIDQEGRSKKFLRQVEQVTFSGDMAVQNGQQVIYITERCVFRLKPDGLHLTEIAPGIDLQRDILDQMEFEPVIEYKDGAVPLMDLRIFQDAPMGLGRD